MIQITDRANCTGCTACMNSCPKNAITMQFDGSGHTYPAVDATTCNNCHLCESVCPCLHRELLPTDRGSNSLVVKAVYNRDESIRLRSTSGGIFTELARYVIGIGGVVCAVRFDENYHIVHDFFDIMDEIDHYRGSKYAQSDLQYTFRQVQEQLLVRPVLFVGSPCQVAGLKFFLRKEYSNLYTCDFICMSIASSQIWDDYITLRNRDKSISRVFFKDKRSGWHQWQMLIQDARGEHLCNGMDNPFFRLYLEHLAARPSCFNCPVRHCVHVSDFTLADCWGIDQTLPEFDDNKGCTTLILQSDKSQIVFDSIQNRLRWIDYDIKHVLQYNPHIEEQIPYPDRYKEFQKLYAFKGFEYAFRHIYSAKGPSLYQRIKTRLKSLLS